MLRRIYARSSEKANIVSSSIFFEKKVYCNVDKTTRLIAVQTIFILKRLCCKIMIILIMIMAFIR